MVIQFNLAGCYTIDCQSFDTYSFAQYNSLQFSQQPRHWNCSSGLVCFYGYIFHFYRLSLFFYLANGFDAFFEWWMDYKKPRKYDVSIVSVLTMFFYISWSLHLSFYLWLTCFHTWLLFLHYNGPHQLSYMILPIICDSFLDILTFYMLLTTNQCFL